MKDGILIMEKVVVFYVLFLLFMMYLFYVKYMYNKETDRRLEI